MLYQIANGTVSAGGQEILSHIDFEIKGKEKAAVVGRNGAGKTTLLRLIAGELELDADDKRMSPGIKSSRKLSVGMLHQTKGEDKEKTVEELLLESCPVKDLFSKERFAYEMEYDRMFTGLGFEKSMKSRKLSTFSGGEQTKIELLRLLLMKPDILLLDEPTNHLDLAAVEWLEGYLREYEKAVVMVSHDRFFLDQAAEVVWELQGGRLKHYAGNYTLYRQQKRKELAAQKKAYERQQAELARLNELVEKFKHKPKKAAFARSRRTMIERMERVEKPQEEDAHMFTGPLEPQFPGNRWVMEAEHLKIGYGRELLELSLRVRRGQKIGIIGDNGVGKSTFLKTVAGLLEPVAGKCTLGPHTVLGYFDQQSAELSSQKQVREHFHELFPAMTEKQVRQTLGAYLFSGSEAGKRVDDLSGGEKARLVLAELLTARPNLLVLDEPTNHMDIPAKETLESAFAAYTGTILFVSHDRYFIRQVADAILVFEGGLAMYYPFGYEHYLKHSSRLQSRGQELAAMVQAEDAAMLEGLKAVPKAERHRLKEIGTDEAYQDWQLRLASQPLEDARRAYEWLWEKWEQGQWEQELENALEMAQERWTEECLAWYEVYLEVTEG